MKIETIPKTTVDLVERFSRGIFDAVCELSFVKTNCCELIGNSILNALISIVYFLRHNDNQKKIILDQKINFY